MQKFGHVALAALIVSTPAYAQVSPTAPAGSADADRKVCKRFDVTGSLVQKKRVCKTKAEWLRSQMEAREEGEKYQGKLCTSPDCVG